MSIAQQSRNTWRLAGLLGVMLLLGSAYFYQDPEWNGNSRLDLTRAIVERGTFEIDAYHEMADWATGDKAFYAGHYYSDKAIGASLMAVPLHFVLNHAATALGARIPAATIKHLLTTGVMGTMFVLAGLSMYFTALLATGIPWKSLLVTLAVTFGTMLWPYSAVFYGHVPAAAFLSLSFVLLFYLKQSQSLYRDAVWFWIGFAVSMAFLSDYTSALVIVGLALYALHVLNRVDFRGRLRAAWPAVPGLLIPLLTLIAYNLNIYGRPLAFGYTYEAEERFQDIMGLGIMGIRLPTIGASYHILLDPKFGLVWLSPVLILAGVGYVVAFRQNQCRAEALLSIYAIAVIFAMSAGSYLWYGGSAFGPRLMISALPFFIVPLALLPDRLNWLLAALALVSAGNMLIPLLGQIQYTRLEFRPDRGGFYVDGSPFKGFSLLYGYGLPKVIRLNAAGQSPWTLGSALGLPLWLSVLALMAAETGLLLTFRRVSKSGPLSGQQMEATHAV